MSRVPSKEARALLRRVIAAFRLEPELWAKLRYHTKRYGNRYCAVGAAVVLETGKPPLTGFRHTAPLSFELDQSGDGHSAGVVELNDSAPNAADACRRLERLLAKWEAADADVP